MIITLGVGGHTLCQSEMSNSSFLQYFDLIVMKFCMWLQINVHQNLSKFSWCKLYNELLPKKNDQKTSGENKTKCLLWVGSIIKQTTSIFKQDNAVDRVPPLQSLIIDLKGYPLSTAAV